MKGPACLLVMLSSQGISSTLLQVYVTGRWHQLLQAYVCMLRYAEQVVDCQLQARSHYLLHRFGTIRVSAANGAHVHAASF